MNFYEIDWVFKVRVVADSPQQARQRAAEIVGCINMNEQPWFLGTTTQIKSVRCYYEPAKQEDDDGN